MPKHLPITAIHNRRFLESLRHAMRRCAVRAIATGILNPAFPVINRRGDPSAICMFNRQAARFEFTDAAGRDITDDVRQAMQRANL